MSRTYDNEKKPSQSTVSFKPTASFLQTRGFAPIQTDLDEDATPRPSGYTENFLEKIINQRSTESSDTPVQAKPKNRLQTLQAKRMSMIQTKLSIGEPNDKYEQAAESATPQPIQAKLAIGAVGDKYEQEADSVAAQVVQTINAPESVQRQSPEEEELLQGKFATVQRQSPEEEELLQGKFATVQRKDTEGQKDSLTNNTGLPNRLKAGVESLSGLSMDGVKVHYNSPQPAQLNAYAYAQGSDIHLAPGQEQHLPHEAWHVVQQLQGRVQPTLQAKGVSINDNDGLEREADLMGSKAATKMNPDPFSAPPKEVSLSVSDEVSQKRSDGEPSVIEAKALTGSNAPIQMVKPGSKADALNIKSLCKSKVKKKGDRKKGKHGGREIKDQLIQAGEDATTVNALTFIEFDVNEYDGVQRDAERIIEASDGRVWFTGTHYTVGSFEELT
jgi:hypothetical protein